MSKPTHALMHLPRTISAAGPACLRAFQGASAPSRNALVTLVSLCALAGALAFSTAAQAETCPNEQLRAEAHSTTLPDCRAYELVTPPFKEASNAGMELTFGVPGFVGMSADGSHVAVASTGNFGDDNGAAGANSYELSRTASGWSETNIDVPVSRFPASTIALAEQHLAETENRWSDLFGSEPLQASPDFGVFLYHSPNAGEDEDDASGSFWIGEADGALHPIGPGEGIFKGASRDLSHVLYEVAGTGELEEERYVAGQESAPAPVGVDPGGTLCRGAKYAGGTPYRPASGMSADGSKVFFSIPAEGCSAGDPVVGELFARVDNGEPGASSVAISEPSAADCSACDTTTPEGANFAGASADGSKVFFTTTQPLLDGAGGIYEYDFDAPAGERVRLVAPEGSGVIQISEDGSHVYFSSSAGNLYVYDTETGATAFIATASLGDSSVTPDGQFLVFTSSTPDLTPDDTSTAQQVFEYDAQTGELVRVSIGQNGFNDNGNTDAFAAVIPPGERGGHAFPPRYMLPLAVSDNGAYVAFESSDGLTPAALNGHLVEVPYEIDYEGNLEHLILQYYAENVYEYHDGDVYLISDGQDTSYSRRAGEGGASLAGGSSSTLLRGLSPSGQDVFFETADRLVPQDLDSEVDLYDARIDGGFPAPVSLLPTCTGDACQGPLSPAPTLLSPGSELQAGEVPPLPPSAPAPAVKSKAKAKTCKKGYVKIKNKCVKKSKSKKAKKSNRRASR